MNGVKIKALGLIMCLALLLGMVPASAAEDTLYVTREQAVVSLLETIGFGALNETESDLSIFRDAGRVSPEYADEIGIAVANGILTGDLQRALNPEKNITRLELALVISRSMRELPDIKQNELFTDVPGAYTGDVNRLIRSCIMIGYGNGRFGAEDYLTNNQFAGILNRIEGLSDTRLQDDFFYAVNRDWLSTTKLPAGYPGLSSFDEVSLSNNSKLKAIVDDIVANSGTWQEGTKEQKMADFYSTIVDVENRNKQGIEPIRQYLERLDNIKNIKEFINEAARLENETGMNLLFVFRPSVDLKDSSRYSLYGSGLSTVLPSAYLINENTQIGNLYENLIAQLLVASGSDVETALKNAHDIYALEKTIAQSTQSNEEKSKVENVYNPMTIDELSGMFSDIDIKDYLEKLGYGDVQNIVITDPGLMVKTGEIISDDNLELLKAYERYRLIISTAQFLSTDLENAINSFNNAFIGVNSVMSEEDKAFSYLNSVMSGYLGRMYAERYFTEEAKKDVEDIVKEIISAYEKRIQKLDWMSGDTKSAAVEKLKAIKMKIGYPDKWNDPLANITMRTYDEGGSLLGNVFAISSAQVKSTKELLTKPVDKADWAIPPHTVNAFYSATSNEIIFPAGILQAPFYDVEASREQNLGGIGSVIAHEITHAFDNNGAQFDKNGNMSNWWKEEDYKTFQQKCQDIINLYDGLEIAPNAIVNGALTVSENIADIGGMACILDIMGSMEDADYKDLFENNARIWRLTATSQIYQILSMQDVHAPHKLRANQVVRNFQEFYDTYDVKPGDAMYLAPENRVTVW